MNNNKGIVLIEVIIIVVLLAIVACGIAFYISEGLRFNITGINQAKALYMAQAGIMRSIVDYRDDSLWNAGQNVNVMAEFYYHLGRNANFLWVDASSPQIAGKQVKRIPIKNINALNPITITDMVVSWTFGGNITQVNLGGTNVWTGVASSPATLNITDFTLTAATSYSAAIDQIWQFSNNASGDVVVTFIFNDGSSHKAYLLKNGQGVNKEFSITSTGEVRSGSTSLARRTLNATYDTGTSRITSWEETQSHIIP